MRSVLIAVVVVLAVAQISAAATWRGITPLHSSRSDVERLLGKPRKGNEGWSYYGLPREIVMISFQPEPCDSGSGRWGYGWNVPISTVTDIAVIPKESRTIARLGALNRFKVSGEDRLKYYYADDLGLTAESYDGLITFLSYVPPSKEESARCPKVDEGVVDIFPKFDEYGTLSWSDERARLDNYVIRLADFPSRAIILVAGPRRRKKLNRAQRAKEYLVRRGVDSKTILIIDRGYYDREVLELNAYPIDAKWFHIYLPPANKPPSRKVAQ